jgi:hypothetical protein
VTGNAQHFKNIKGQIELDLFIDQVCGHLSNTQVVQS